MPTLNPALEALIRKDEQKRGGLYPAVIVEISANTNLASEALQVFNEKLYAIAQITESSNNTRNPLMLSVDITQNTIFFCVNPLGLFQAIGKPYNQSLTDQLLHECSEYCYRNLNSEAWKLTFHNLT